MPRRFRISTQDFPEDKRLANWRELYGRGYDLVLTARRTDRLQALKKELEAGGPTRVHVLSVDLGVPEGTASLIQQVDALSLPISFLVNNAGFGLLAATEEASDAEARKQYDTNVFGLLNVIRAVLPQLRKQRSGHIINISSLFGYMAAIPGFGIYGSTKFAVEGISEGLALEVKPLGIHVTAAAPGLFRTNFASADSYQLSNNKLVHRGTNMVMAETGLDEATAAELLKKNGSVRKAVDFYQKNK